MNLQELIQKNIENHPSGIHMNIYGGYDGKSEDISRPVMVQAEDSIKHLTQSQQSILKNILEYIEGEKNRLLDVYKSREIRYDSSMKIVINSQFIALQLIADYIKGDNK